MPSVINDRKKSIGTIFYIYNKRPFFCLTLNLAQNKQISEQ